MTSHPILEALKTLPAHFLLKEGVIIGEPKVELSGSEWRAIAYHINDHGRAGMIERILHKILTPENKQYLKSIELDCYDIARNANYSAEQSTNVNAIMQTFNENIGIKFFDIPEDEENCVRQVIEETITSLEDLKNSIPGDDETDIEAHSHLMSAYRSMEEAIASLHSALSLI